MQHKGHELLLIITDDGIGLPNERMRKKNVFGLAGIEERICVLNGKFSMISNPGQGTAIAVSIPLPHERFRQPALAAAGLATAR